MYDNLTCVICLRFKIITLENTTLMSSEHRFFKSIEYYSTYVKLPSLKLRGYTFIMCLSYKFARVSIIIIVAEIPGVF